MEHSVDSDSDSLGHVPSTSDTNISSSSATQPRKKRARKVGNGLPEGQKRGIYVSHDGVPEWPPDAVTRLSSEAARLAERDIPIYYPKFTDVPPNIYDKIIALLDDQFTFENTTQTMECPTVRRIINDASKRCKCNLKRDHVNGIDPILAKAGPAPGGIPIEDWRKFVDMCNSKAKKESSARNKENRTLQVAPNCSGRTSAPVRRRTIANNLGVKSSQVPRSVVYIDLHTTKEKVPQQPEIVAQITADMEANPNSQHAPNDAVSRCVGLKKASRGRMLASGVGISKTSMKKMLPVLQRNEFVEQNNEVWKQDMTASVAELKAMVTLLANPLSENVRNRAGGSLNRVASQPHEDEASSPSSSLINSSVLLQGGWPPKDCAKGVIKSVNPSEKLGDRLVGSRNYIVYINAVIDGSAQLPEPHDAYITTLAELGQGLVIWPKGLVEVLPSRST